MREMQTNRVHEPEMEPSGERSTPDAPNDLPADARDTSDDGSSRRSLLDAVVLVAVAVLLIVDLVADAAGTSTLHITLEVGATGFAVLAAARLWSRWMAARRLLERRVQELSGRLRAASEDAERWRAEAREALEGLGAAIERQCDRWGLTEAERAVAVLLLKGLSMKEVADARGTAERTARQQALAVYRKAGLTGRAELSAFFLEDLLLPSSKPASRS
jgi:DNA-binding CsgD family transcriptional regulator